MYVSHDSAWLIPLEIGTNGSAPPYLLTRERHISSNLKS